MTHLFVFQQFCFPLITFLTLITAEGFVGAMYVLDVVVEPGVAWEVFGADMTHEARSGTVLLQVHGVQRVLRKLLGTVTAALGDPVGPTRAFVEMIDELDGAGVILAHVLLTDRTIEARGLLIEIRTVRHNVQAPFMASPEVMFEKLSVIEDLVTQVTGIESRDDPAQERLTHPLRPLTGHLVRLHHDLIRVKHIMRIIFTVGFFLRLASFFLDKREEGVGSTFLHVINEPD